MNAHNEAFEQVAPLGDYEDYLLGYYECFVRHVNS